MTDTASLASLHAGSLDGSLGVSILDVGHGNSAVVHDGRQCAVVDAAPGNTVLAELERLACERIEHLVISHSDKDHAGGGPTLLLDDARTIGTVWFNPDSAKQTEIWPRLLRAVHTRKRRGGLDGHQMIHTETGQVLRCGQARLEIHHPSILLSGIGPGGLTEDGNRLDANSLSVVVRVHLADHPAVLLAADIDAAALRRIQQDGHKLTASVLVFPHHGGLPGSADPRVFARDLTELVEPDLVVFSIRGGQRPSNPNPAVMSGVREGAPEAHIACTQLSVHCHERDVLVPAHHLALLPAAGRKSGRCCAGTITVTHTPAGLVYDPPLANHLGFVTSFVSQPLCRANVPVPSPRSAE